MALSATLAMLLIAFSVAAFSGYRQRQPVEPGKLALATLLYLLT